jgi:hypothetical protein
VTHPSWVASATDAAGIEIAQGGEALLRSHDTIAANWVTLASRDGRPIHGITITSDCRNEGRPFAGSQAALIQEMQLVHS